LKPFFAVLFAFYEVKIAGKENLPLDKGFILAANHLSFLDGPFISFALYPRHPYWIVAKWIYSAWYFHPLCVIARCVPVISGTTKAAQDILDKGGIVGIFPTGCIMCDKIVKKGRKGVAVLALATGLPVVPCYIDGEIDPTKKMNIVPKFFKPLKLTFGKPLYFEKYPDERIPSDTLEAALTRIIDSINGLA